MKEVIAQSVNVCRKALFGKCSISNPTFIGFGETSSDWYVQFFFLFFVCYHMSGKPTRTDQNGSNFRIGKKLCRPSMAAVVYKVTLFCHD